MFELVSANIADHSPSIFVGIYPQNGEPTIVITRIDQTLQLISQALYGIRFVELDGADVSISLIKG